MIINYHSTHLIGFLHYLCRNFINLSDMTNFDYQTPTRLIFGKGVVEEKLEKVMNLYGKRVLITYGGGSIKRVAPDTTRASMTS